MELIRKSESVEFVYSSEEEQREHEQRMITLGWKMVHWYSGGESISPSAEYQKNINVPD